VQPGAQQVATNFPNNATQVGALSATGFPLAANGLLGLSPTAILGSQSALGTTTVPGTTATALGTTPLALLSATATALVPGVNANPVFNGNVPLPPLPALPAGLAQLPASVLMGTTAANLRDAQWLTGRSVRFAIDLNSTGFGGGDNTPANVAGDGDFARPSRPVSIEGSIVADASDEGDQQLAGVEVTLTGTDANGQTVVRKTVTGTDGKYRFDNLPPGHYIVSVHEKFIVRAKRIDAAEKSRTTVRTERSERADNDRLTALQRRLARFPERPFEHVQGRMGPEDGGTMAEAPTGQGGNAGGEAESSGGD